MIHHVVLANLGDYGAAAAMTFAIPIGTLLFCVAFGFFQRKPMPTTRRAPLFPLRAIPQHSYDLAIVAALHERDRAELESRSDEQTGGAERPVGD